MITFISKLYSNKQLLYKLRIRLWRRLHSASTIEMMLDRAADRIEYYGRVKLWRRIAFLKWYAILFDVRLLPLEISNVVHRLSIGLLSLFFLDVDWCCLRIVALWGSWNFALLCVTTDRSILMCCSSFCCC